MWKTNDPALDRLVRASRATRSAFRRDVARISRHAGCHSRSTPAMRNGTLPNLISFGRSPARKATAHHRTPNRPLGRLGGPNGRSTRFAANILEGDSSSRDDSRATRRRGRPTLRLNAPRPALAAWTWISLPTLSSPFHCRPTPNLAVIRELPHSEAVGGAGRPHALWASSEPEFYRDAVASSAIARHQDPRRDLGRPRVSSNPVENGSSAVAVVRRPTVTSVFETMIT